MDAVSVDTAVAVTDQSRRTWWRKISKGEVSSVQKDHRGRTMLSWPDVLPYICTPLHPENLPFVLRADAGDADAQNDVAQFFMSAGQHKAALYWLQKAVEQNHADAMLWLGHCYINGHGVPKNEHLGVMWIAKAAAHGHLIAQSLMNGLLYR